MTVLFLTQIGQITDVPETAAMAEIETWLVLGLSSHLSSSVYESDLRYKSAVRCAKKVRMI